MNDLLNDIKIEVTETENITSSVFSKKVVIYLPLERSFLKNKYIDGTQQFMGAYLSGYWGCNHLAKSNDKYIWCENTFAATEEITLNLMVDKYIENCKNILLKVVNKNLQKDLNKLTEKYNVKNIEDLIQNNYS